MKGKGNGLVCATLLFFILLSTAAFGDSPLTAPAADHVTTSLFKIISAAAAKGDATAQDKLGNIYYNGSGRYSIGLDRFLDNSLDINIPQDYGQAMKWYKKAAAQGYADAENNLGAMYYYGDGVPQDYSQAVMWYQKAAEQSYADAQYNLGFMYNTGKGVPQDSVQAAKWFILAKAKNADGAYADLQGLEYQMTPAQVAEAQHLASAWWKAHHQ